ncbi:short-chain dehydrogenase reductase SDR [Limtongia smithiae]|uniref:short-chain dehydrogenase reductase SDR n=1 Tax=Limtongia smithiae TaxID=1125753 RepID=UPI0034CFED64
MVQLTDIRDSNTRIATELPAKLVAVFVGATGGIGETTMKQFAKHVKEPFIYFVGRTESAAVRIKAELAALNPQGKYIFLQSDVSLIRNVDTVCNEIKKRETAINVLCISAGTLVFDKYTSEGILYFSALSIYSRFRFIENLLPLLDRATGLRRVLSVLAGTKEGELDRTDITGQSIKNIIRGRRHTTSMMTLGLEVLAKKAPSVTFVHDYPGFVKTNLGSDSKSLLMTVLAIVATVLAPFLSIPIEETGERHLFFLTSARFPGLSEPDAAAGVALGEHVSIALGSNGEPGSGVYSIDYNGDPGSPATVAVLAKLRKEGAGEQVWEHIEDVFTKITGNTAA